jgi:hypothetical protein
LKNPIWEAVKKKPDQWMLVGLTIGILIVGGIQVSIFKGSTKADLRAYLEVTVTKTIIRPDTTFVVWIRVENLGKTPAYNAQLVFGIIPSANISEKNFQELSSNMSSHPVITIPPGGRPTSLATFEKPTAKQYQDISVATPTNYVGVYKLNVIGDCTYEDEFGDRHHIRFAQWYSIPMEAYFVDNQFNIYE